MSAGPQALLASYGTPPSPLGTFTFNSGTAAITVAWPTDHAANDIGILLVATNNQALATPSGWNVINTPAGNGASGGSQSSALFAFWRRAVSSSEAAASVSDSGNYQVATMFALRGADLTASPIEAATMNETKPQSTVATCPTITTLGPNRYVVAASSSGGASTTNQSSCTWTANSNLDNFTELTDNQQSGNGAISSAGGQLSSSGGTGTTSASFNVSAFSDSITFAVKPRA